MKGGASRPSSFHNPAVIPLSDTHARPSVVSSGLRCRCPRCGRGKLLQGFLSVRPRCESCGLNFEFIDSGDGPAFFVMSFVGIVVVALAMWVEFAYTPPIWLHMALWIPLTLILTALLVRPAKGLLVALQFAHKAEEGRLQR